MADVCCRDIMTRRGFAPIGTLECDLRATLWWHAQERVEVALVEVEEWTLARGTKHYRLVSRGDETEVWTRDLAAFDEALVTLFGETHVVVSSFPYVTPRLALGRIAEKGFRAGGGAQSPDDWKARLEDLSKEISVVQADIGRDEGLLHLDSGRSALLGRSLRDRVATARRRLEQLQAERRAVAERLETLNSLQGEYQHKGASVCLLFACCSNIQVVRASSDFADALEAIVKELQDLHRFQIRQKLQGGRLQVHVEEVDEPGVSLLTRWAGGALCPRQIGRLGPEFASLRGAVERQLMVFPRKDILLGGAVQDEKKLVAARIIRNFLRRLECVPQASRQASVVSPTSAMPAWVGRVVGSDGKKAGLWEFPLDGAVHTLISGRTGSGKSFKGRVLIEAASGCENLAIVILDPRDQWAGLLMPEDRPEILRLYREFGLEPGQARSFDFSYHGVGQRLGRLLPDDLRLLAQGRHIVSFKGQGDGTRCELFARILDALFDACASSESPRLRLLVVVEEAHRFVRKGVIREAHEAAQKAELSLNRIAREGRKYGVGLTCLCQSSSDFSHAMATVRENIATHIFLGNGSREAEYAAQFLGPGDDITSLRTGEAFVSNAEWGVVRISVRPPLSKVWEPTEEEIRALVGDARLQDQPALSRQAQSVLAAAWERCRGTGQPVRLSSVVELLGVSSRRRVNQIVAELETAGVARFERLPEQGRPLVMVPLVEVGACTNCSQTRTETGANGERS